MNMKKNIFRAFIAVPLPDLIKAELISQQRLLKKDGLKASFPQPAALHLTLRFLGNIDHSQANTIKRCMAETARRFSPFDLILGGMGGFPKPAKARVLWAGVIEETGQMEKMVSALNQCLFKQIQGLPYPEKRFSPHLTLARSRKPVSIQPFLQERLAAFEPGEKTGNPDRYFTADHMILYKSFLKPSGAVHQKFYTAEFSG